MEFVFAAVCVFCLFEINFRFCLPLWAAVAVSPSILFIKPLGCLRMRAVGAFLCAVALASASLICLNTEVSLGQDARAVTQVEGTLVSDSGVSGNLNEVFNLRLESCVDRNGTVTSANGIIFAAGGEPAVLCAGTCVRLQGSFSDGDEGFFLIDDWLVTESPGALSRFRLFLIRFVNGRLSNNAGASSPVLCMLLLGRSDSGESELKTAAQRSGCLHVLALSGMHLSIVSSLFFFVKNRRRRALCALPLCTLFVFVAGPRSSLLRALLMMFVSVLPLGLGSAGRLLVSFILQALLFADSLVSLGAVYSYFALSGILVLSPRLSETMALILPERLSHALSSGFGAIVLSSVVSLSADGVWRIQTLFLTPLASLFIAALMALSLLVFLFPHAVLLRNAADFLYARLLRIFNMFAGDGLPAAAFYLFLASLLSVFVLIKYCLRKQRKAGHKRDVELQLRFSGCD